MSDESDSRLDEALDVMNDKTALTYTACLLMAIVFGNDKEDIKKAGTAIAVFGMHDDLINKYCKPAHEMMNQAPADMISDPDKNKGGKD